MSNLTSNVTGCPCKTCEAWRAEKPQKEAKVLAEPPLNKYTPPAPPPTYEDRVIEVAKKLYAAAPTRVDFWGFPQPYTWSEAIGDAIEILLNEENQ